MSMNGNPHYDDGRSAGVYYATRTLDADADVIALAATEATLALAYEQRTANLIALYSGTEYFGEDPDIRKQIEARLNLS